MRFSPVKHLPLLVCFLAVLGCGNSQEEARKQLGQMNIKFTEDSFVTRARDGNLGAVKLFLQAGMKPDVTNAAGDTPLLVAVKFGRQDVAETLLARGADPNLAGKRYGVTPLIWASTKGFTGIMNLLLAKGANVNGADEKIGMTALMSAAVWGQSRDHHGALGQGSRDQRLRQKWPHPHHVGGPLWPHRGRQLTPGEGRRPCRQGIR